MTSWRPFGITSDPKSIVLVDILRRSTSGLFASHIIRCSYWNGHDVPLAVLVQLLYRLVPSTSWLQHTLMSLPSIVWLRSRTTFTSSWTILPTVTSSLKSAQLPVIWARTDSFSIYFCSSLTPSNIAIHLASITVISSRRMSCAMTADCRLPSPILA